MANIRESLHSKIHTWMKMVGFRLNSSNVVKKNNLTIDHYFFKTFNFIEQRKADSTGKSEFVCFDTYGEKMKVRSLLDLQSAFYENLSELR
ncbi:hypothetical protein [Mucilaginibacter paludis]|uniref:Uncharacterized protein n=1 Tax=Mucilaginibacter paludis DSM 18603 TaxID=714943 RepID=H1Y6Q4_9SPHI|nr:hypothetical protein [Mucilaginibacter paludis]EHQ26846.1 hypothetical protein Mucpa_2734 [Mucilaginibacter paludis DSM 18603]